MFYKVNVRRGRNKDVSGDASKYQSIDEVIVETKLFSLKEICTGYSYDICFKPVLKDDLIPNNDFVFEDELRAENIASFVDVKNYIDNFNIEDRSFYNDSKSNDDSKNQRKLIKYLKKASR